jgi:hypothetical protein
MEAKIEEAHSIAKENKADIVRMDGILRGSNGPGVRGKQEIIDTRLKAVEKLLEDNKRIMTGIAISVVILLIESLWQIIIHYTP